MLGLLFTYALTFGGAAISMVKPFYGLLIYVCFAIIRPHAMWPWSVSASGNYSRIVAIGLLAGWAINGFGNWNLGKSGRIALTFAAFLGWMAIAAVTAFEPTEAWNRVEALSKIFLPFLVGMTTIRSVKQLNMLIWVMIASEGYLAYRLHGNYYAGIYNMYNQLNFADLDNNGVAITMVATAGMAFFVGLRETVRWRRGLAFLIAVLTTHVVLFSNSRGGMLALVITAAVAFVLIRKQPSHYWYFAIALIIGLQLAGPPVIERFSTMFVSAEERDVSAQGRLDLSVTMIRIMSEYPITGIGAGNFMVRSQFYGWPPNKDGHTTWLQVGAENGIPGMLLLVGFYVITIMQCWRLSRPSTGASDELADVGRMTIASIVGFMISAQFVTIYGVEFPYYVVLLGASAVKLHEWGMQADGAPESDVVTDHTAAAHPRQKRRPATA